MTNSSPQPPENESRNQPILNFDEKIAIIVAFLTIGSILFWSLGSGLRTGILSASGLRSSWSKWTNYLLSSSQTTEKTDLRSTKTKFKATDNIILDGELSEPVKLDTLERRTSKYLDRQPKIKEPEHLDSATAFTRPTEDSFGLIAPTVTGIALGKRKTTTPKVTPPVTPQPEEQVTTPDVTPPVTPQIAFTDLTPNYWAYPFIEKLGKQQLIANFSGNGLFEPEKLITRASMATLISQAFDRTASQPARNFTDVSENNIIAADIKKAVETGFMKGYSEREFRPLENIPRYQVLVTLASGLDLQPSPDASATLGKFDDMENIPDWAKEQVAAAIEAGLAVNRPEFSTNSLNLDEPATRAEVAAMIHQALVQSDKLEPIDSQYIVRP
ncbi:MAG: S-layer homology domain-containing protein [Pleurocapsa sp.]